MNDNFVNKVVEKVRTMLESEKTKLEQMVDVNGVTFEAEAFEVDNALFIVTEDELVAAPDGNYEFEGMTLTVSEGVIVSVDGGEAAPEAEEAEAEVEEEMSAETTLSVDDVKAIVLEAINALREELKGEVNASAETVEEVKEEVQEEVKASAETPKKEEVELSEKPLKGQPKEEEVKKHLFSQGRVRTTADRVFEKIANIKKK